MQALIKVFWDIARWRRGPRDLPASPALLAVVAVLYLCANVALTRLVDGPVLALTRGVADLGFTLAAFWLCLVVGQRAHRVLQTLTAVLGTGTLVTVPAIALAAVGQQLGPPGPDAAALTLLLLLPVLIWQVAVLAHIVQQALDAPLVTGIAVATSYALLDMLIAAQLPAMVG
jgi:hypothetical protein